jgi:hypothetical protein
VKTDLPDDLGPLEPGLDQLISALTAGPTRDELAGEPAALAMFRAAAPRAPLTAPAPAPPARRRRRYGRRRLAGVFALALAGGLVAAAYFAVLPEPVQHAAYRVLGFVGVPDAHHPAPSTSPSASAPAGHRTSQAAGRSPSGAASPAPRPGESASAAPQPSPSGAAAPPVPAWLYLTAARYRIVAGSSDSITALLTDQQGRAVPGQQLTLQERATGSATWTPAGQAATGSGGSAVLTVQSLTANAWLRLTGPDGTQSRTVLVIAVPAVTVTVASGQQQRADTLTASSPLAVPGNLAVLQIRSGGGWLSLRSHQLSQARQAVFVVPVRLVGQLYRVALIGTLTHGASASAPVVIPPGPR